MKIEEKAQQYYNQALSNCSYGTDDLSTKDVLNAMIQFATEMCEIQKQRVSDVMEDVVYDDRIGNMSYESVEKAILNTKNVCED